MPHFLMTDELKFSDALELAKCDVTKEMEVAEIFFLGDHYHNGEFYIGPKPVMLTPGKANVDNQLLARKIKELFTAKNVIAEVVNRQAGALLTEPASVSFDLVEDRELIPDPSLAVKKDPQGPSKPDAPSEPPADAPLIRRPFTKDEQKIISEADRAFAAFAEAANLAEVLQTMLERLFTTGKAVLRVFIPERYQQRVEAGQDKSLVKVARFLRVECPKIKSSSVIQDGSSGFEVSITVLEQMTLGTLKKDTQGNLNQTVEIGFVDDKEKTFLAVIASGQAFNVSQLASRGANQEPVDQNASMPELSTPLDLDGLLLAHQVSSAPLINEQVMSLNRLVNLGLTMSAHVAIETGHSEMSLLNVELEKEVVYDATLGRNVERPVRIMRGGGFTHNFIGVTNRTKDGSVERATPDVKYKEPSPIDTHVGLVRLAYTSILEQCSQLHAAILGDATASGESRRQALVDFIVATHKARRKLDNVAEWLVKTVLLLAANSTGQVEDVKKLRPIYRTQIFIGDMTSDERTELLAELSKDVRSIKSVRDRLGLDNDAEAAQIIKEALSRKATNERLGLSLQADKAKGDNGPGNNPPANSGDNAGN